MTRNVRLHAFVSGVLSVVVWVGPARGTTLSGAILFSADTAGNANNGSLLNTLGSDSIPNLYLVSTMPS